MERILDLELLKIKDSIEDYTYFGGNQEWFETNGEECQDVVLQLLQRLLCMRI